MTTKNYYKPILTLAIVVLICSLFWLYWTLGRSLNMILDGDIPLRNGFEFWQISFITSYSALSITLIVVQIIFLLKQLKSIRNGYLFEKSNTKYIIIWGILWIFYDFCSGNISTMISNNAFNEIVIEGTLIGIPTIVITFAILYKMAADVADENNLTI